MATANGLPTLGCKFHSAYTFCVDSLYNVTAVINDEPLKLFLIKINLMGIYINGNYLQSQSLNRVWQGLSSFRIGTTHYERVLSGYYLLSTTTFVF
jgi:hypothetical protein